MYSVSGVDGNFIAAERQTYSANADTQGKVKFVHTQNSTQNGKNTDENLRPIAVIVVY